MGLAAMARVPGPVVAVTLDCSVEYEKSDVEVRQVQTGIRVHCALPQLALS